MKNLLILFLTLTINFSCAQKTSDDVKTVFNHFLSLTENKNYDEYFDYYYSGFLKIVPKSQLLKDLEKLNSNENYEYQVKDSKIISVTKVIKKDNIKYALIKYGGNTHIKFNDNCDKEVIELIKQNVQNTYGEKYSYSELNKEIVFYKDQEMIGITENGWKFFPYSERLETVIATLIPKEVLKKLLTERK
ncbi:hypothetical protein [Olleya marilimosa]|uniref:hypothetical protein n=1 Tax=Olleya marilimosa TaxID=272164 RepID=UPI00168D2188|nr:hypothetical protein [Olleya marilimosa]MBD3892211.1 hypothetical protein [Olleya marilimosa]